MDEKTYCHECGTEMPFDIRPTEVKYKHLSRTVQQHAWYCDNCGEALMHLDQAKILFDVYAEMKAEVDGLMLADEIKRIRRKLGLSQRRAGAILGGGARSFQKYESGCGWISRPMANLLRLLDNDPSRLKELIPAKKQ